MRARMENGGSTETGAWAPAMAPPTAPVPPTADAEGREDGRDDGCDLVTVPARQGLEAVDILRRGSGESVGPVLHDDGGDTLGFLVPPGTADGWDVPGSTCTRSDGRGVRVPWADTENLTNAENLPVMPVMPDTTVPAAPSCGPCAPVAPCTPAPYEPPPWPQPPEPPVEGSNWLLPPGEADPATDPAALRAALDEAARLIKAADSCR